MATELFNLNRAQTTVTSGGTGAPAPGSTETWTVASSAMFGAAVSGVSQFHVADPQLPSEIIAVTNVSGTTWSVTRGAENTTPVAHAGGFTVYQATTAGWLSTLAAAGGSIAGSLTVGGALSTTPVALTDASSIAVNAALSNVFTVTLGGNRTLASPANPANGQAITFEITQDGTGSRTLAYGAAYSFPASIGTPVLSSTPAYTDTLAFRYSSAAALWICAGFVPQQVTASAATVSQGGTGQSSLTAYELIAAGTTTTGAVQQIGAGSSGQLLGSGGGSALPSFQSLSALGVAPVASPAFTGTAPSWTDTAGLALTTQGAQLAATSAVSLTTTNITSLAALSIPSGDPVAGAVYRVTAYGFFTTTSTAVTVTMGVNWGGTGGSSLCSMTVTPQASETNIFWQAIATVMFVTSSTCNAFLAFTIDTAGSAGYAGTTHSVGTTSAATVTVSGTESLCIVGTSQNTTNLSTFTCFGSFAERIV